MRKATLACAAAFLAVAATLSCDRKEPLAPESTAAIPQQPLALGTALPPVVISQIYGAGGNSGATLKNDYVELHNTGTAAVSVAGWSVQYASAGGSSWQVTSLTGTIAGGAYYLVKETAQGGGTVDLPTPDATGNIAMAAGAGKVSLAASTTALTGTCPSGDGVVDQVGYGTTATNCGFGITNVNLGISTAAFRKDVGCAYTGTVTNDFETGTPAPRNSASPSHSCGTVVYGPPAVVTVAPDTGKLSVGTTLNFSATARDASNNLVPTTFTWATGDTTIATVSSTGLVTAVALGTTPVVATSANGIVDTAIVVVQPPAIHWMDVSSSSTSFPPGFQTQMFVTARTASGGTVIPANFTFEALDPGIATVALVQNTGIVTGVSASATRPRIKITATPVDGATPPYVFTTTSITIETPAPAPLSIYATNDEFGDPTAASPSNPNDLLIVRPQYTISYNESRGTPNWVSYELDSRQMVVGQDRCNCFTADPTLPADKQILTSDYTNGGFDRGHMTRSADRTAGNTDNAATFYLTNIVPQMADLNQGVWAQFENALGDSATKGGRAVYIITGPLYSRSHGLTFLKNEGKVAVPDSTWKIAFIGPVNGGVPFAKGNVQSWTDLPGFTVLAVSMPNVAGVRYDPWSKYLTTVDRIEAATGYDFLSLLPVAFQTALEENDHAPVPSFAVSGTPLAHAPLVFDASASTDPDFGRTDMDHAEALSFSWSFGDGTSGSGVTASKAFGGGGTYTVTLTVTDAWGWPSTSSQTVVILTPLQGIAALSDAIASLGGPTGPLGPGEMNSLRAKLNAAAAACRRDSGPACGNVIGAFVNELQALVNSGRLSGAAAAPLIDYAELVAGSTAS